MSFILSIVQNMGIIVLLLAFLNSETAKTAWKNTIRQVIDMRDDLSLWEQRLTMNQFASATDNDRSFPRL